MKDLLEDEEIKFPIFGNRMSNYSNPSFRLN
jgi:hypothetical protein